MRLLVSYITGLFLCWVGLHSILAALANWGRGGAFVPLAAGVLLTLVGIKFLFISIRLFFPKKEPLR